MPYRDDLVDRGLFVMLFCITEVLTDEEVRLVTPTSQLTYLAHYQIHQGVSSSVILEGCENSYDWLDHWLSFLYG